MGGYSNNVRSLFYLESRLIAETPQRASQQTIETSWRAACALADHIKRSLISYSYDSIATYSIVGQPLNQCRASSKLDNNFLKKMFFPSNLNTREEPLESVALE
jgi:hypothetical protein